MNEQQHINALAKYADEAGLPFTMSSVNDRQFLVVEINKTWSLFNLAACLMESAFSAGQATQPVLNTDGVLYYDPGVDVNFAWLAVARPEGIRYGDLPDRIAQRVFPLQAPVSTESKVERPAYEEITAAQARTMTKKAFPAAVEARMREVLRSVHLAIQNGQTNVHENLWAGLNNKDGDPVHGEVRKRLADLGYRVYDLHPGQKVIISWDQPTANNLNPCGEIPLNPKRIPDSNALTSHGGHGR